MTVENRTPLHFETMTGTTRNALSKERLEELFGILKTRFEKNAGRHV